MSKSKGNTVDPQALIDAYGADTARLFMMFAAPPEQSLEWADSGVQGAHRFLKRLWQTSYDHVSLGVVTAYHSGELHHPELSEEHKNLRRQLHMTIEKVGDDYGRRHSFNTAISSVMELMNTMAKMESSEDLSRRIRQEVLENVALLLSPIVPHISQAIWAELKPGSHILQAVWPHADKSAMVQNEVEYVVQVNGKLRGSITLPKSSDKAQIEATAVGQAFVQKYLENASVRKVIIVPNKLVNIVVS